MRFISVSTSLWFTSHHLKYVRDGGATTLSRITLCRTTLCKRALGKMECYRPFNVMFINWSCVTDFHSAKCHSAECHSVKCHSAEWHYAE